MSNQKASGSSSLRSEHQKRRIANRGKQYWLKRHANLEFNATMGFPGEGPEFK